jgi:mannose-6-phosphate isomerase-like protein (cupin superfamily)
VAMPDAVLVADKSRAQDVKAVVDMLRKARVGQADDYPRFHRPWGWYETLCLGDRFQVKRIMVKPGGVLSLQSHHHRSEHWIVVAGTAEVTVGDEVRLLTENESVYIPLGETHRMANPGKLPMYLIEVQTGPIWARTTSCATRTSTTGRDIRAKRTTATCKEFFRLFSGDALRARALRSSALTMLKFGGRISCAWAPT